MSFSQVSTILRAATRGSLEPLNILTFPTHERYETGLCKTGHNFYAIRGGAKDASGNFIIKDWNEEYASLPENYTLLAYSQNKSKPVLPMDVDFDLILCQNKMAHYEMSINISNLLHLPLVCLTHVLPPTHWDIQELENFKSLRGHYNVFISEYNREHWGWEADEADVIHHCVDIDLFHPTDDEKNGKILSVVNDWKNRDWCCGYNLWQAVTKDMPVQVFGKNPGLSRPAESTEELAREYAHCSIFLNTSLVSPIPTALLEAMSCGAAVVSTKNCMIPEIITNGHNGYCFENPRDMREKLEFLMNNPKECKRIGDNARQTIIDKFHPEAFVNNWNRLFKKAANTIYTGPTQQRVIA